MSDDPIEVLKRANAELPDVFDADGDAILAPTDYGVRPVADCYLCLDAHHVAAVRNALPAVIAEVERLRERVTHLETAEVAVHKWGLKLCEGLGTFLEQVVKEKRPLTTKIMVSFGPESDVPLVSLWATTDAQSPINRLADLKAENARLLREIANLQNAALAAKGATNDE